MASPQVGSGSLPAKLSFAKIAAMPPPQAVKSAPNPHELTSQNKDSVSTRKSSQSKTLVLPPAATASAALKVDHLIDHDMTNSLEGGIEGLALVKNAALEQEAAKVRNSRKAAGQDSIEDEQSHLSNNSSREPPSFDTKSIASVTTFAMDEKESLRPDDSASVQAIDDEDSSNGPSRNPSIQGEGEVALKSRTLPSSVNNSFAYTSRRFPSIALANPPRFGDLPMSPITEAEDGRRPMGRQKSFEGDQDPVLLRGGGPEVRTQILSIVPDEKLLDALATPKDRLPLLQLEEKIVAFISNPNGADFLDLPPQNSFGRLLAHKLADYYSLQHFISDDNSSVRLFKLRASSYILPTPLATLASSILTGPPPPPGSAAFKIMRRNGLGARENSVGGSTAASSSAPSKATSENGGEGSDEGLMSPADGVPLKDKSKLTREEREANYKAARERIFGDFQESVASECASTTGDTSASISRSSSSSGKRKVRKQKTPKDDSFEARSSFLPGYASMPVVGQQNPYQQPYAEPPFGMQYQNSSPNNMALNYGSTPTQAFPGYEAGVQYPGLQSYQSPLLPNYGGNDSWSNAQSTQPGAYYGYPAQQSTPMFSHHSPPIQSHALSQYPPTANIQAQQLPPNWPQNQYGNSFQQTPTLQNSQLAQWATYGTPANNPGQHIGNPYQYGQLPPQPYVSNPAYNTQHPVPGSYVNRSLFNPNSRSFVPSNSSSRSGGRGNSRKKNNGSANSSGQSKQRLPGSERPALLSQNSSQPASSNSSSPRPREDIPLQQKYGAPAHLPKKPPPSQVPLQFEVDPQVFSSAANAGRGNGGPLIVNGGGDGPA